MRLRVVESCVVTCLGMVPVMLGTRQSRRKEGTIQEADSSNSCEKWRGAHRVAAPDMPTTLKTAREIVVFFSPIQFQIQLGIYMLLSCTSICWRFKDACTVPLPSQLLSSLPPNAPLLRATLPQATISIRQKRLVMPLLLLDVVLVIRRKELGIALPSPHEREVYQWRKSACSERWVGHTATGLRQPKK